MIRNYLKTAIRNLKRNKLISFINIFGLSLALGCCITVFTFLEFAYTQDNFHEKRDRVYLLTTEVNRDGTVRQWGDTPIPLSPMIAEDYPQVKSFTRMDWRSCAMKYEDLVFEENTSFVDKAFFEMFSFPLKYGSIDNFDSGTEIIIAESLSLKYFGDENPVGRQIVLKFPANTLSFTIGGVFEQFPRNASFYTNIAAPFPQILQADPNTSLDDWQDNIDAAFIELDDPASLPTVIDGMNKYIAIQNQAEHEWPIEGIIPEVVETLSVRSEYISRDISGGSDAAGNIIMFVLGLFMLILASFNYINTSIASGAQRLKEIGIRKVVGGVRTQLVFQFITENMIMTFMALLLGVLFAAVIFVPGFESLFSVGLALDFGSPRIWIFFIGITLITGIASGAYPAFYISSFKPIVIFRGRQKIGKNRFTKIFLTFQFILSLLLISGGFAFVQNSKYQAERDWGYNKEQIVVVPIIESKDYAALRNEISQNPNIVALGGSGNHAGRSTPFAVIDVAGEKKEVRKLDIGKNYSEIMEFRLMKGRMLDAESAEDRENYVVVNQTFVNEMGIAGDPFAFTFRYDSSLYTIAGVIEDFHYNSFYDKIMPMFLRVISEENYSFLSVKTAGGKSNQVFGEIESSWKELFPDVPFLGFHQDEVWGWYFTNINGHGQLLGFVAILSIILSCMGLFGLVSLNVTFRMKEFSIRKALGANTMNLTRVMNKQFIVLLIIATILGIPLSYMAITGLMDIVYTYRMPNNAWPFFWGTVFLYLTSIATISSLIFKVLRNNPAQTLRAE